MENSGSVLKMKKVYICSRYRADDRHTVEDNIQRALYGACRVGGKTRDQSAEHGQGAGEAGQAA